MSAVTAPVLWLIATRMCHLIAVLAGSASGWLVSSGFKPQKSRCQPDWTLEALGEYHLELIQGVGGIQCLLVVDEVPVSIFLFLAWLSANAHSWPLEASLLPCTQLPVPLIGQKTSGPAFWASFCCLQRGKDSLI